MQTYIPVSKVYNSATCTYAYVSTCPAAAPIQRLLRLGASESASHLYIYAGSFLRGASIVATVCMHDL